MMGSAVRRRLPPAPPFHASCAARRASRFPARQRPTGRRPVKRWPPPPLVLSGHAASLTSYESDASAPRNQPPAVYSTDYERKGWDMHGEEQGRPSPGAGATHLRPSAT